MSISVIIPAYNEESSILEVIRRVRRAVPFAEIIVVDDGSTDKTAEIAKRTGVKVISYKTNKGKAHALKVGYENSTADVIVTIDADCTYPPEDISRLLTLMKRVNADLVVGSRFVRGFAKMLPLYRNVANMIGSLLISFLLLKKVTDVTSGLRAFKRKLTVLPIRAKSLDYEVEFTVRAIRKGFKYHEIPIGFAKRRGVSKLKFFKDCLKFLIAAFRGRFG